MKTIVAAMSSFAAATLMTFVPVGAASAWEPWGQIPYQVSGVVPLTPGDTTLSYDLDSAFKPPASNSATGDAIDVEWNFFYGSFAAGYGACTTNATPGAYECPGGITVQVTPPDGNPFVVTGVELVDRTDWSAWDVTPMTDSNPRAATLVVSWSANEASNFSGTLTEVRFPKDSVLLPSDADQALVREFFFPEAAMFWGAGAFTSDRQGFTQYTGGVASFGSGSSSNDESLADTGNPYGDLELLAVGLVAVGVLARIVIARWALRKN
jgi:hypothetical protein